MYLAYGSYSWDTGSVHLQTSVSTEFAENGRALSQKWTVTARGTLTAASQSAIKTATLAMEAALRRNGQNLILYQDDGSESALVLKNAGSLTGVRVTSGPNYPTTEGAENALFRTWEATFEAEYPSGVKPDGEGSEDNPENYVVRLEETLSVSGGGARYVLKPNVLGVWQKQLVYPQTPYVATQSGTVTGLRAYPPVPAPIFPQALVETQPKIDRKSPRQEGLVLRDWAVTYSYEFASVTPLVGLPNYMISAY